MAIFQEKEKKREHEQNLRHQTNLNKGFIDQNLKINRRLEKEKILAPKKLESERVQLNALKRQITERNKSKTNLEIQELEEDLIHLKQHVELNPRKKELEDDNMDLNSKVLRTEKEIGVANSKSKEMQMLLDQRSRARQQENILMRGVQTEIITLKNQIDEASRINELNIVEKVKDHEEEDIRRMCFLMEELKKDIEYYEDRNRFEEEEIERMGNEKVIIQQDYIDSVQVRFLTLGFIFSSSY